jgi:hypothetical protein
MIMSRIEILLNLINLNDKLKDFQISETPPQPAQPFQPKNLVIRTDWRGTPRAEKQRRRNHVRKDHPR